MKDASSSSGRRPSLFRIAAFALLCGLFLWSAILLHRYSGIIGPLYGAFILGVPLFFVQFQSNRGSRDAWFFLFAALYYVLLFYRLCSRQLEFDDAHTGMLLLLASAVALTAFWLTVYRRWKLPLFRTVLAVTLALWILDVHTLVLRRPLPRMERLRTEIVRPRFASWTPEGTAFYIHQDDEINGRGRLHRVDIQKAEGSPIDLPGIVSRAAVAPDGQTLAVIHEDKSRRYHLSLMDPLGVYRQEVFSSTRGVYFPFRNTGNPWSSTGRWALFIDTALGQVDAWVYDRQKARVQNITSGEGAARAFWIGPDRVAIPRGSIPETVRPTRMEWLEIRSATDGALLEKRPFERPYDTLYAYPEADAVLLKEGRRASISPLDCRSIESVPISPLAYLQVAFSQDGRTLVYAENEEKPGSLRIPFGGGWGLPVNRGRCRLKVFDRETREERILFQSPIGFIQSISCSPSGQWIAFSLQCSNMLAAYGASVLIVSPETGKLYKVATQDPDLPAFYRGMGRKFLSWQPGREHLLFWDFVRDSDRQVAAYWLVFCPSASVVKQ